MGFSFLEAWVRRLFLWYGPICHRFKWPLFILPCFLTIGLSTGFLRMNELRVDDPSYVFTPSDSRWKKELKVFTENWPLDENHFLPGKSFETKRFVNILIRSKDGGSILRTHILKEIEILNDWISNNISVPTTDRKFNLTYQDLCLGYNWVCGGNEHISMLLQRSKVSEIINLAYPRGGTKDTPVYLGTILGDVRLNENHTVNDANMTQLVYFLKQEQRTIEQYSSDFSYAVEHFLKDVYSSEVITYSFAHYQSLEDGLEENANSFGPNFVISFLVLATYAVTSSFCFRKGPKCKIDWVKSKPYLACAGLITTILSILSAFGFLMLLGINYNVINTIIPFLIIAIGIDDMFIMNACWDQTDEKDDIPKRLSKTLEHAGVAITITNVTDIMSFAIGCFTDLPGIQLFCLYACCSVFFSYLYQLTYFCGLMAILGDLEKNKRHCLFFYKTIETVHIADLNKKQVVNFPNNMRKFQRTRSANHWYDSTSSNSSASDDNSFSSKKTLPIDDMHFKDGSTPSFTSNETAAKTPKQSRLVKFFAEMYGPFLLRWPTKLLALVLFAIYVGIAAYGCVNFREGLNPANLVTNGHYIEKYFKDIKSFWASGPQLHVAVLNPPNLTDPVKREALFDIVKSLENTDYTMGREGTVFFLFEYMNYLDQLDVEIDNTDRLWNQKLKSWLKFSGGSSQWASDIRMRPDGNIQAFRFQIAMKHIVEPNDHKNAARILREIADSRPFNVTIYHEAFPFADQYLTILPSTIQNILISLACMTVVSILMVPSLPSGLIIFISIISINIGVFGYMTLWGVNLDAVSMISIIMSIGFAVDLSAHIIYAFVTAHGDTNDRIIGALIALGWPIFQGASSTIAGISILYTVDAYIILTFFKTIWLTMVIGAVHGLFFIPIFLSLFPVKFFRIPKTTELH